MFRPSLAVVLYGQCNSAELLRCLSSISRQKGIENIPVFSLDDMPLLEESDFCVDVCSLSQLLDRDSLTHVLFISANSVLSPTAVASLVEKTENSPSDVISSFVYKVYSSSTMEVIGSLNGKLFTTNFLRERQLTNIDALSNFASSKIFSEEKKVRGAYCYLEADDSMMDIRVGNAEVQKIQKQLDAVLNSTSYRLGNTIVHYPSRALKAIKHMKKKWS